MHYKYIEEFYRGHLSIDEQAASHESEIHATCPVHPDASPSFSVNKQTGLYKCFAQGCELSSGGNIFKFLAIVETKPLEVAEKEIKEKYEVWCKDHPEAQADDPAKRRKRESKVDTSKKVFPHTSDELDSYHSTLINNSAVLDKFMSKTGLTLETINKYNIGYNPIDHRYWIPIKEGGKYVNVRRYSLDREPKMLNVQHFGEVRLFPFETTEKQDIFIFEGEKDCLLAQQNGIDAVTATGGAGAFKNEWKRIFSDKNVFICYDIDEAGTQGAKKVAKALALSARSVRIINLPITEPANADFADFLEQGHSAKNFMEIATNTKPVTEKMLSPSETLDDEVHLTSLDQVDKLRIFNKRIESNIRVATQDQQPSVIAKQLQAVCSSGEEKKCNLCKLKDRDCNYTITLDERVPRLVSLTECTERDKPHVYREIHGIPPKCEKVAFTPLELQPVTRTYCIPAIDDMVLDDNFNQLTYVERTIYVLGDRLQNSMDFTIESIAVPSPKDQSMIHLAYKARPASTSLTKIPMTPKLFNQLAIFKCKEGQSIGNKLNEIYDDFSQNVTRIYGRRLMHAAIDLSYHSVRNFHFNGRFILKGMHETVIMGDTRCGKTETTRTLMNHYRLGAIASGEHAAFSGLVGGCRMEGKRWRVTWGRIPMNHLRHLVIDEMSGVPVEDVAKMSDVRSSGIAEINKIHIERTPAMTRLLWISNPRLGVTVAAYGSGIPIIEIAFGKPEDIARIDFPVIVSKEEVTVKQADERYQPDVPHIYTSDACHNLIQWCWSRTAQDVNIEGDTVDACYEYAEKMSKAYSDDFPIVHPMEQKIKLARLATAIACRLFSTADGENVIVTREHVAAAYALMCSSFNAPNFGYNTYSIRRFEALEIKDDKEVSLVLAAVGGSVVQHLLESHQITLSLFEELTGLDRSEVRVYFGKLVRNGCLRKKHTFYIKTVCAIKKFKEFLKMPTAHVRQEDMEDF